MSQEIQNILSSKICTHCGGLAEGWKCIQCKEEVKNYSPIHKCGPGKSQPKCKGCRHAEDACTCCSHHDNGEAHHR